jgi:hypothetical protein
MLSPCTKFCLSKITTSVSAGAAFISKKNKISNTAETTFASAIVVTHFLLNQITPTPLHA